MRIKNNRLIQQSGMYLITANLTAKSAAINASAANGLIAMTMNSKFCSEVK
jgi:hypothetical protein